MTHHVTLRGVAQCDVFRDDLDRRRLLSFAANSACDGGARCLAFALMRNHCHFIFLTGSTPLSDLVHGFAFRYAQYFNWRHGRVGHLFQDRFGSEEIDSDEYLRTAIAYVHLNPLKAGVTPSIASLSAYPWTGQATLAGVRSDPLIDAEFVLSMFGTEVGEARASMVSLLTSCLARWDRDPNWSPRPQTGAHEAETGGTVPIDASSILGRHTDELARARAEIEDRRHRRDRLRRAGWTVDRVIVSACALAGVEPAELFSPSRRRPVSEVRAIAASIAASELGESCASIARSLGIGETAARRATAVGRGIVRERGITLGDEGLVRL